MATLAIGLGAGGHAKVMIELLRAMGNVELVGMLDRDASRHGQELLGVPILGGDEMLSPLVKEHGGKLGFFLGLGSVGDNRARTTLFNKALEMGAQPFSAIHPSAQVSPSCKLGAGVIVVTEAIIHPEAEVGDNVLLNTACLVEHDCRIGAHVVISPRASLMGAVTVGEGAFVGAGAVVLQGVTIGDGAVVAAGAVVRKDVPPGTTVFGNPAQTR